MSDNPAPFATAAQPEALTGLTVCRICNHAIVAQGVPLIGESPEEKAKRLVLNLADHIKRRHPEQAINIQNFARLFADVLVLQCYATEDPILNAAHDAARAQVHAQTRKNMLTDEEMRHQLANLGMSKKDVDRVMPIGQYLRDFLGEQGKFEHPLVKAARPATVTQA